jgi:hypothetical protein
MLGSRESSVGQLAQLVRALRSHRRGHRFESCAAHWFTVFAFELWLHGVRSWARTCWIASRSSRGNRNWKHCLHGLRITVSDSLKYPASWMTAAEILADFPELTSDDIRACLACAAERERRLLGSVA